MPPDQPGQADHLEPQPWQGSIPAAILPVCRQLPYNPQPVSRVPPFDSIVTESCGLMLLRRQASSVIEFSTEAAILLGEHVDVPGHVNTDTYAIDYDTIAGHVSGPQTDAQTHVQLCGNVSGPQLWPLEDPVRSRIRCGRGSGAVEDPVRSRLSRRIRCGRGGRLPRNASAACCFARL